MDDDDRWVPDKIERQVGRAAQRLGAGVVGCGRWYVNRNGEVTATSCPSLEGDLSVDILCNIPYVTSALMVRRDALLEVGCFDESLTHWLEYEL